MSQPNNELLRELLTVFIDEAEERLQAIDRHLIALEQAQPESRAELFAEILREVHTLKGSAGAVDLDPVSTIAHALETFFGRVRDEALRPDPEIMDIAYRALDAIRTIVRAAGAGQPHGVDVPATCSALIEASPDSEVSEGSATHPDAKEPQAIEPSEPAGPDPRLSIEPPHPAEPSQAPSQPKPDPQPSAVAPTASSPAVARPMEETVRVATAKLDALMAQVGELLVGSIGAEQRLSEVRAVDDALTQWESSWHKVRPQLQRLARLVDDDVVDGVGGGNGNGNGYPKGNGNGASFPLARELRTLVPYLQENARRVGEMRAQVGDLRRRMEGDDRRMRQVTGDLQEDVRRTRMLPVSTIFDTFPRMVRDLARDLGKEARLELEGVDTEVDRPVLEQIRAPLTHLLRNCVDHGLEAPEVRLKAGKPREGTIRLAASQRGGMMQIDVADDGAGIDPERVRSVAVARGVIAAEAAKAQSDRDDVRLIFRSGLSTSPIVTDVSGRGVGLDVVRETVERLNGMIDVESRHGIGTTFSLSLPITVATTQCLLVRAGHQTFGLPITSVSRILRVSPEDLHRSQGRDMVSLEDEPVMVTALSDVLRLGLPDEPTNARHPAVLVQSAERRALVLVDSLVGSQDVVIKSLPRPLVRVRYTAGATILGSGEVVVILNAADVVRLSGSARSAPITATAAPGGTASTTAQATQRSVLVADDSMVTRMLEKSILEAAGYRVLAASDGLEAWAILESERCDLIVSDVNMPRMNGLELTARIRADGRFKNFPVILVTSLDSPDDHARGIEAGADAYIVKSTFSQQGLLETINRLI